MDLNKVMLIGRLTRDPEVRTTPQGVNVTSFGLATNLVWTNPEGEKQEKVEYHNIVAWRKLGEICAQFLKKGRRVYVEGRIQTRTYTNKEGIEKSRTEIVADNMIILDTKPAEIPIIPPEEKPTEEEEINVEEIPF